ncbi:hypothetical protein Tco_1237415 [Tanacetum coccineum]
MIIETITEEEMRNLQAEQDITGPISPSKGRSNHRVTLVLTLDSLTKHPKEILATEIQLRLPSPRPMLNPLRSGNTDRYCDYHQEKGHYTNDCIQLRKQLEMTLESGKLNHLVKDVRQRGRGSHARDAPQPEKIINVISVNSVKDKKQKGGSRRILGQTSVERNPNGLGRIRWGDIETVREDRTGGVFQQWRDV